MLGRRKLEKGGGWSLPKSEVGVGKMSSKGRKGISSACMPYEGSNGRELACFTMRATLVLLPRVSQRFKSYGTHGICVTLSICFVGCCCAVSLALQGWGGGVQERGIIGRLLPPRPSGGAGAGAEVPRALPRPLFNFPRALPLPRPALSYVAGQAPCHACHLNPTPLLGAPRALRVRLTRAVRRFSRYMSIALPVGPCACGAE